MSKIAILNSESLLGRELKQGLDGRPELRLGVRLLSTETNEVGVVTEGVDGPSFVQALSSEILEDLDLLVVCPGASALSDGALPPGLTTLHLSSDSGLGDGVPIVDGINLDQALAGDRLVSPHPAVVACAHFIFPLLQYGIDFAACWALLPASLHGQEGLDELFDQTRTILNFEGEQPQAVFGAQLAFNLLPTAILGPELAAQLGQVLGDDTALTVQVLQASTFHGVAAGASIRFRDTMELAEVRQALVGHSFIDEAEDPATLGPAAVAGRATAVLGGLEATEQGRSVSLWGVIDNLTLGGAGNAISIIEALIAPRT